MLVSYLAGQGIDATTAGEYTAGFRAEAPGDVQVLVRHADLEKALLALESLKPKQNEEGTSLGQRPSDTSTSLAGRFLWLGEAMLLLLLILGLFLGRGCFQ